MKTGWYSTDEFFVVKPLKNGCRQSLIMGANRYYTNHWNISMGIFSSNIGYNGMMKSTVWAKPTSTNKNPSLKVLPLALEALKEIEEEIHGYVQGKKAIIYVDGLDERRLRIYTKVLTKKCGYKISTSKDRCTSLPLIYKVV